MRRVAERRKEAGDDGRVLGRNQGGARAAKADQSGGHSIQHMPIGAGQARPTHRTKCQAQSPKTKPN